MPRSLRCKVELRSRRSLPAGNPCRVHHKGIRRHQEVYALLDVLRGKQRSRAGWPAPCAVEVSGEVSSQEMREARILGEGLYAAPPRLSRTSLARGEAPDRPSRSPAASSRLGPADPTESRALHIETKMTARILRMQRPVFIGERYANEEPRPRGPPRLSRLPLTQAPGGSRDGASHGLEARLVGDGAEPLRGFEPHGRPMSGNKST